MKKYISIFTILLMTTISYGQQSIDKKIVAKVKDAYRSSCSNHKITIPNFNYLESSLGILQTTKLFPTISKPETVTNKFGDTLIDISLIYEFTVSSPLSIEMICRQLFTTNWFEYVEQKNTHQLLHTPNDPNIANQYYLNNIKAYSGWDISKGDSSIIVGISDNGFDFFHPDLTKAVAYNYSDPIDGIDNDNDGYVDNYMGWNLAQNNNNPQFIGSIHGIIVSGLVSAQNNNGVGMASVGYNTKILPLKINEGNILTRGYESIVYGATHGCAIINCSWGGQISDGQFGEDIINFATYNCNVLVVAACGNDNTPLPFWPATYRNVLSVGATDINDIKANFSTYGWDVDIMAPGNNIYSTWSWSGNQYGYDGGTSYSAPITAACAAIVKSYFSELSPIQVAHRLRVTADNIDTISNNSQYVGKMGKGRINLFRALTDLDCPSIRYQQPLFSNNSPKNGDTVDFYASFKNYLKTTENLKISFSLVQGDGTIITPQIEPSPISTMEIFTNQSNPFKFVIGNNNQNAELVFKITYIDTNYSDFEYISLFINKNYIHVDTNHIATTFSGNSRIGFADNYYRQGLGFNYLDYNQMFYMSGLMIGKSTSQVSDNVYGESAYDADFTNITAPIKVQSSTIADYEAITSYNDNGAGSMKLNLKVTHQLLAWDKTECENFIIHSFTIKNVGSTPQSDLYVALYNDWDIYLSSYNKAKYDVNSKMFYCWSPLGGKYGGVAALSENPINKYAFDNDGSNLSIDIYNGFTGIDKFTALTSNRDSAGYNSNGKDISTLLTYKQISLAPGDSITLNFVLVAGETPQDLIDAVISAKEKMYPDNTKIDNHRFDLMDVTISPNPASNQLIIRSKELMKEVDIFTSTGLKIQPKYTISDKQNWTINTSNLASGIYIICIKTDNGEINKKIIINR